METISRLARRFGLSRSTLLYYDRRGLLRPSGRSAAGYRRYSADDALRLETICLYRSAGVPLAEIRRMVGGQQSVVQLALRRRLEALQAEMSALRAQQAVVVRLLGRPEVSRRLQRLDKRRWVALFRSIGLDEAAMRRWHVNLERAAPRAHREFLEQLGMPSEEVRRIRMAARRGEQRRWAGVKASGGRKSFVLNIVERQ